MKCCICGKDQFRISMKDNSAACLNCHSVYSLDEVAEQLRESPPASKPVSNPRDFEIVGGVLKRYHGSAVDVVVPDGVLEIAGEEEFTQSVLEVPPRFIKAYTPGAFSKMTSLRSVQLPESVRVIGKGAFAGCTSLSSVNIPKRVTKLAPFTFSGCKSLSQVHIPSKVTVIGWSAFAHCEALTEIQIPNEVTGVGDSAFEGCTSLMHIVIPESVREIGKGAFSGCTSLVSANISKMVTVINTGLFFECESLQEVNIPERVTHIYPGAFGGCKALKRIEIPKSVKTIGEVYTHPEYGHVTGYGTICGGCPNLSEIVGADRYTYQMFKGSVWYAKKMLGMGMCPKCGSKLSLFGKRCKTCNISY